MLNEKIALFFSGIPPEIATFLISMTPISELRGAIPIAVGVYDMPILEAFFWAVLGNILIAIILVFLLDKVSVFLSQKFSLWKNFFDWLFLRTRKRAEDKIKKYGMWGLYLLVAVPLPMTGGWTGAVAAFIFGIPKWKAVGVISLGVLTAGIIVSLLTVGVTLF